LLEHLGAAAISAIAPIRLSGQIENPALLNAEMEWNKL
jgi:hypothetical protein